MKLLKAFTVGRVDVMRVEGSSALAFLAGLSIDADGSPRAYHPGGPNAGALDYTANAGHSGNWYGVVTDTNRREGHPVIQGPDDPAPGFYVSPTSLQDTTKPTRSPLRYVDASRVPFIALPPEVVHQGDMRLGDLAMVMNGAARKMSAAIFADGGPRGKLGEGSPALAVAIGVHDSARIGGASSGIGYVLFPGSGRGWPRSVEEFSRAAAQALEGVGGMDAVLAALGYPMAA